MVITEFGKLVRKARVDAEVNLSTMAEALDVSPAFLSGLETGRKKISADWVEKVLGFFASKGIVINGLWEAADISNQSVSIDGLDPRHQQFLAAFARMKPDADLLNQLEKLLGSDK